MKGLVTRIAAIAILLALMTGCGKYRDGNLSINLLVPCDPIMDELQTDLAMVCLSLVDIDSTVVDGPNCSQALSGVKLVVDEKTKPVVVLVEGFAQTAGDKYELAVRGRSAPVTFLSGVDSTVSVSVAPVGRFALVSADSATCRPLPMPVAGHTATVFPSGHVVVIGTSQDGLNSDMVAMLFDTYAGTLERVATPNSLYRWNHTATLLDDGRLLVAGGRLNSTGATTELVMLRGAESMMSPYNPSINYLSRLEFEPLPARLPGDYLEPTAALFFGDQVLLVDGFSPAQVFVGQDESLGDLDSGNIPAFPQNGHTATPVAYDSGAALIGGLQNRTARLLLEDGGRSAVLDMYSETTSMRDRAVGLRLNGGKVMIIGYRRRFDRDDAVVVIEPPRGSSPPAFQSVEVPADFPETGFSATLLPDGRVVVVGGLNTVGNPASNYYLIPNPDNGRWYYKPGPELNMKRKDHTAVLLPDGRLMVIGGTGPNGGHLPATSVEVISF